MKNIEDEEIRKGVFLVLEIEFLKLKKKNSDEKFSKKIESLSKKLEAIPEEKQLKINREIIRILEEKRTT